MSEERTLCQATTKSGTPCKRYAVSGSAHCRTHSSQSVPAQATPAPTPAAVKPAGEPGAPIKRSDMEVLVNELNSLAEELRRSYPSYTPPRFTPGGMVELLKQNLERFTPDMQFELVNELKRNLEGTSPKDLIDPDTWKGLWYILNYTAQAQSAAAMEKIMGRLSGLPGVALLSDLKGNLEGTSPKELLDPETWKGMFLIMNYSVRATASDLKRKLLGDSDDTA